MAIYKTRWFDRWANKEGLLPAGLCAAVREMAAGLFDAELGSGLFKKRVGRPGQGKRGGYRTLVATNKGNRWVFVYGFPKNERSNIDATELLALRKLAGQLLALPEIATEAATKAGELIEVNCDEENEVRDLERGARHREGPAPGGRHRSGHAA